MKLYCPQHQAVCYLIIILTWPHTNQDHDTKFLVSGSRQVEQDKACSKVKKITVSYLSVELSLLSSKSRFWKETR